MIRNNFRAAFRHLTNRKYFTLLNLTGLSVGISAALVIFLIVRYELSFDKFQRDNDRIYRVVMDMNFNGMEGHNSAVPAPLGGAVQNSISGISSCIPVFQYQGNSLAAIRIPDTGSPSPREFRDQQHIIYTNQDYFDLLGYRWLIGDKNTALQGPYEVVLTLSRAKLYFNALPLTEIVGRQITYNDLTVSITGIVEDLTQPTDFTGKEFISLKTIESTDLKETFMWERWDDWMAYSSLFLKASAPHAKDHIEDQINKLYGQYRTERNQSVRFVLQPLHDLHFNTRYPSLNGRLADKNNLWALAAVSAFLLLLACINYINLNTAYATFRAKEIGIRKTMGSSRVQLIRQFLGETMVITTLSAIFSFLLAPGFMILFEDYLPQGLSHQYLYAPHTLVFLLVLVLTLSILAGIYPAFILSGYAPVNALKNQIVRSGRQTRHAGIRKTLTVFQFSVALFFILAALVVRNQINYAVNSNLGFETKAIIKIGLPNDSLRTRQKQLLSTLQGTQGIVAASEGFMAPADKGFAFTNISFHNGKEEIKPQTQYRWGDENYLPLYDISLVAGRNVSSNPAFPEIIVNESFAKAIGFDHPEKALGASVQRGQDRSLQIVGVMKDFHDHSMHLDILPLIYEKREGNTIHIRMSSDVQNWPVTLNKTEKAFNEIYPGEEFSYDFIDETIRQFYAREETVAGLLQWAVTLSILISCLGLLGLTTFTINARTKEIGIRKVLGASVMDITGKLSGEFVVLVLIALVIASPVAWWAMNQWLQDFAYRIEMQWWMFAIAGLLAVVIALATVSSQAIKAALANPVDSLRNE